MIDAPVPPVPGDPPVRARPPVAPRRTGEPWVQVTLCVIVASLLLLVAMPDQAPRAQHGPGAEALQLRHALARLRAAIEGYRIDHGGWPGLPPGSRAQGGASASAAWLERQLVRASDDRGAEAHAGTVRAFGPYLRPAIPANAVNGLATVRVLAPGEPWPASPDGSTGWIYRPETGEVRANSAGSSPGDGIRYDQL